METVERQSENRTQPLMLLLIGTGRMADLHAARFAELAGVSILAAVDTNPQRLRNFCRKHAILNAYSDLHKALEAHAYDAVTVVTPDSSHAAVTLEALKYGLPVLCEKPLADTLDAAERMTLAAEEKRVVNMVNFSYRTSGALHKARMLVDDKVLGEIRHIEASYRQSWLCNDYWGDWREDEAWLWRLSKNHGSTGVLGDVGIHILDYLLAGTGLDISGLHCRLQTFDKAPFNSIGEYQLDANDSCVLNIELENGALGVVHMSRFYSGFMNDLEMSIHGTSGALKLTTGENGDKLLACIGTDLQHNRFEPIAVEAQPDTFKRFVDALQNGTTDLADFAHATKLQRYLDACFRSHDAGQWLTIL
ncbi:MAG: Gfo/Idh/MocA family protein [Granulosicoccus sp.]